MADDFLIFSSTLEGVSGDLEFFSEHGNYTVPLDFRFLGNGFDVFDIDFKLQAHDRLMALLYFIVCSHIVRIDQSLFFWVTPTDITMSCPMQFCVTLSAKPFEFYVYEKAYAVVKAL